MGWLEFAHEGGGSRPVTVRRRSSRSGLTFEEAAPGSEGSHYALSSIRAAKVRRGQDVLVYGATGAIGSAAVQLLKQVGATSRLPARVLCRRVNHGTERSATVTAIRLLTWPCHALPPLNASRGYA
jgi:hypothetical protein